jgi:hypothetical protein
MTAPALRRDLSPLTSASLEASNVVIRELDVSGPVSLTRLVVLRPEERRALATFLAEVEAGERQDEEPQCGAIRREDDAVCVELEGHDDAGYGHLWAGGRHDLNLCQAEPIRLALPKAEPREGVR